MKSDTPARRVRSSRESTSGRQPARRRRWILLGIAVLLLGGAVGAWWWWRPSSPAVPPLPTDVQDPEVLQDLERARQQVLNDPDSAAAWGELGMTLLTYLYFAEADRCFAEAARLDPSVARWPYYRYSIAGWLDPTHAFPFLEQAAEIGSTDSKEQFTLQLQLADALLERQQRLDQAERLYREVLRRQASNPRAALGLGLLALGRGEEQTAERFLTAARSSPYARKRATAQLAALARVRNQLTEAEQLEQEATALTDDSAWPDPFSDAVAEKRVGRARQRQAAAHLEQKGRFDEAARLHLRLIEKEPTQVRHYVDAGLAMVRMGKYDQAIPLLRKAVKLDPDNCVPYNHLARMLFRGAQLERERSADSLRAREWFEEAVGAARSATERKPDYADAYLLWGQSLLALKRPAEAIAPLKKGVACRPEVFDLQLALGEALLDAGPLAEAETHLENARKLKPKDARLLNALERLRRKKG